MRIGEVILLFLIVNLSVGCSKNPVTPERHSRNDAYDTTPAWDGKIAEPYAERTGRYVNGENVYLIHWQGEALDGVSRPEKDIDSLGIPKYPR